MANTPSASPASCAALSEDEWRAILAVEPSLLDDDPRTLTLQSQLDFLAEVQRQRAWLASLEARALVAIAGSEARLRQVELSSGDAVGIVDERVDLMAVALRRSASTVGRQVRQARALHSGLPRTLRALEEGAISPEHAEAIARTCEGMKPTAVAVYEERVLLVAADLTPAETAALARRVRARVDAEGEERRRHEARRHIDVRIWAEDDGLACLMARLPLADAARVHAAIEAGARHVEVPCDASLGERRVAGLVAALCGPSGRSVVHAEIGVVVDLETLMGGRDDPALVSLDGGSAEPMTAGLLRELLADPATPVTLRRLVTDPHTGGLLDRGRSTYRIPDDLRAFLLARDGTCRFPGCRRRAVSCQIDHALPWDRGGATDRDNLGPLCVRHHLLKTHAGWDFLAARPDGATEWRGPDGREYVSHQLDGLWRKPSEARRGESNAGDGRTIRPPSTCDPPPF